MRQAARWSVAANQDESPMIAVLHSNYGAAYLYALRDIYTDSEIEEAVVNLNIIKFKKEIMKAQDKAVKSTIMKCPQYAPELGYLTMIASSQT